MLREYHSFPNAGTEYTPQWMKMRTWRRETTRVRDSRQASSNWREKGRCAQPRRRALVAAAHLRMFAARAPAGQRDQHGCGKSKLGSTVAHFAIHPIQTSRCGAGLRIASMYPGAVLRADDVLRNISEARSGLRACIHLWRGHYVACGCPGACRFQFKVASAAADQSALR